MLQRKIIIVALILSVSVAVVGVSSAFTPAYTGPQVEHEWIKHPHHERVVKKFNPTGTPSPEYVENVIIPYEADRYNTTEIQDRVECESSYIYNNGNGSYFGLIATNWAYWGPAWSDLVNDRDREVVMKEKKRVSRGVYKVRLWDTGKKTYKKIAIQHVRRVVIKRGKLPKNADYYHGWAAIRVGTRAVAGVGPTTYWVCTHNGSHY